MLLLGFFPCPLPLRVRSQTINATQVSYNTTMKACFRVGQYQQGLALFDRMRSFPPRGEKSTGTASTKQRRGPSLKVFFPSSEESATAAAVASRDYTTTAVDRAAAAAAVRASAKDEAGGAAAGVESLSAGSRSRSKGKGQRRGREGTFRASSLPRPDTVSYNTVIAAVASAWGWEGRGQAMALLGEMRVRARPEGGTKGWRRQEDEAVAAATGGIVLICLCSFSCVLSLHKSQLSYSMTRRSTVSSERSEVETVGPVVAAVGMGRVFWIVACLFVTFFPRESSVVCNMGGFV